jgi:hypothetical protein
MEKLAADEDELVECIRDGIAGSRPAPLPAGLMTAGPQESEIVPFKGFTDNLISIRFVDSLSDEDLRQLNDPLPWKCFVADVHGRRFGNAARPGKRCEPQVIPVSFDSKDTRRIEPIIFPECTTTRNGFSWRISWHS